jgi:arylsulfatase A-like enzyme
MRLKPEWPLLRQLALRLGLVWLAYELSRLLFWIILAPYFPGTGWQSWLHLFPAAQRFTWSHLCTVNLPWMVFFLLTMPRIKGGWWRFMLNTLFLLPNILSLGFDLADIGYYPYVRKRMGADVLHLLGEKSDFLQLLPGYALKFWPVFLMILAVMLVLPYALKRINKAFYLIENQYNITFRILAVLVIGGLFVIGIRGGFQLRPLMTMDALLYTDHSRIPLIVNTPFHLLHSIEGQRMPELHFMPDDECRLLADPRRDYGKGRPMQKENVVILVLESFGKSYTGLGGRKSVTPFLDSLMGHSLVFSNAWANAFRSADGIPACVAGIPHCMDEAFPNSPYATQPIDALPALLKGQGYSSAFFHGGTNGTMGFQSFAKHAGFDRYHGRTEYGNDEDYDGTWGIWDGAFLQYTARQLQAMKPPFFATVFTLSSHEPFALPKGYHKPEVKALRGIERGIAYADDALRSFFQTASQQDWFRHTLFVITADHSYMACRDSLGFYDRNLGLFAIPVLFYHPGRSNEARWDTTLFQQSDIPATVLDYLGYPSPFFSYGKSAFDSVRPAYGYHLIDRAAYFRYGDRVITAYGDTVQAAYSFLQDSLLRSPLPLSDPASAEAVRRFRAYRQMLSKTILGNQMCLKH